MSEPQRRAISSLYDTIAIRRSGLFASSHSGNRREVRSLFPS